MEHTAEAHYRGKWHQREGNGHERARSGFGDEALSNSTFRVSAGSDHASVVLNQSHAPQTSEEILKVVGAVRTGQSTTR